MATVVTLDQLSEWIDALPPSGRINIRQMERRENINKVVNGTDALLVSDEVQKDGTPLSAQSTRAAYVKLIDAMDISEKVVVSSSALASAGRVVIHKTSTNGKVAAVKQ